MKIALYTVGGLVGLAVLAVAVLLLIDPGVYKGTVEGYVSRATGRSFRISGAFETNIGRQLSLQVGDVRIGNAEWGSTPDMLTVGRFEVTVDFWSLFRGPVRVRSLVVHDVDMIVEAGPAGELNWDIADPGKARKTAATDKRGPAPAIAFDAVELQRFVLRYGRGWLDEERRGSVTALVLAPGEEGMLEIEASGELESYTIDTRGSFGPLENLLAGRDVRHDIRVQADEFVLHSQGAMESLSTLVGGNVRLEFTGPDIGNLLEVAGLPRFASGAVAMAGLVETTDGSLTAGFGGSAGDLEIDLHAKVEDVERMAGVAGGLSASGPDLRALGEILGLGGLPEGPFEVRGAMTDAAEGYAVRDVELRAGGATVTAAGVVRRDGGFALDVTADGPALAALVGAWVDVGLPDGPFEVAGTVNGSSNGVDLRDVRIRTGAALVGASGSISPGGDVALDVTASGPDLAALVGVWADVGMPDGPFEVRGAVNTSSNGVDLRDVRIRTGAALVTATGSISAAGEVALDVIASGPDLAGLVGVWADVDLPAAAFDARGRVLYPASGRLAFEGVTATVAGHSLSLDGTLGELPGMEGLDARVRVAGSDLASLIPVELPVDLPPGKYDLQAGATSASGRYTIRGGRLELAGYRFTAVGPLGRLPSLQGSALAIDFSGPDLAALVDYDVAPLDLPGGAFAIHGTVGLAGSILKLGDVLAEVAGNKLSVDGQIGLDGYAGSRVNIDANGPDINALLKAEFRDERILPYRIGGSIELGETLARFDGFTADLGRLSVRAQGTLPLRGELTGAEFSFDAAGPDLNAVAQLADIENLPADPFRVVAHLASERDAYVVDSFEIALGKSDLAGELRFSPGDRPRLSADLRSTLLDLSNVVGAAKPVAGESSRAPTASSEKPPAGGRVIPDTVVPVDWIRKLDADVSLDAGRIELPARHLDQLDVAARLEAGVLELSVNELKSTSGNANGVVMLDATGTVPRIRVSSRASDLVLREPVTAAGLAIDRPPTDFETELEGRGRTVREMAASLDGYFRVEQRSGQLENVGGGLVFGDLFTEVFRTVNPFAKTEPYTKFDCSIAVLDLTDGIGKLRAAAVQTDKLKIGVSGELDLNTEGIDIAFTVKPREGLGVSVTALFNPYIKLGGTLGAPAIELDPERGVVAGGAAVLTGGLSILAKGLADRYLSAPNVCDEARAAAGDGEKAPPNPR